MPKSTAERGKRKLLNLTTKDCDELSFFYETVGLPFSLDIDSFREMLARHKKRILHGSQEVKSSRYENQIQILKGWDCSFSFPFDSYHVPTKEWHRKVRCSSPIIKEIWKTSVLEAEQCRKCHDQGGSAELPKLPIPKKPTSKPKSKPVTKEVDSKVCASPECDKHTFKGSIKKWPDMIPEVCLSCYNKALNNMYCGEGNRLGAPLGSLSELDKQTVRFFIEFRRRRGIEVKEFYLPYLESKPTECSIDECNEDTYGDTDYCSEHFFEQQKTKREREKLEREI